MKDPYSCYTQKVNACFLHVAPLLLKTLESNRFFFTGLKSSVIGLYFK